MDKFKHPTGGGGGNRPAPAWTKEKNNVSAAGGQSHWNFSSASPQSQNNNSKKTTTPPRLPLAYSPQDTKNYYSSSDRNEPKAPAFYHQQAAVLSSDEAGAPTTEERRHNPPDHPTYLAPRTSTNSNIRTRTTGRPDEEFDAGMMPTRAEPEVVGAVAVGANGLYTPRSHKGHLTTDPIAIEAVSRHLQEVATAAEPPTPLPILLPAAVSTSTNNISPPPPQDATSPADGLDTTTRSSQTPKGIFRSRKRLVVISLGVMLLVGAIAGGVAAALSGNGRTSGDKHSKEETDEDDTPSGNKGDDETPMDPILFEQLFQLIEPLSVSSDGSVSGVLSDSKSPQYRALEWLVLREQQRQQQGSTPSGEEILLAQYGLAVLYYSTDGDKWTNDYGFMSFSVDICDWNYEEVDGFMHGVICSSSSVGLQEVTTVNLPKNRLSGKIADETLRSLVHLKRLDLSENDLIGSLPESVGGLKDLEVLNLANNAISEDIPTSIGGCQGVLSLDLSNNEFRSKVPMTLGNLENLNQLRLSGNSLTGSLEDVVSRLTNLQYLLVSNNEFTELPSENTILNLQNLKEFIFGGNFFDATLPSALWALPRLEILRAEAAELSGPVGRENITTSRIREINLPFNSLTGVFPTSLEAFTDLVVWDMAGNLIQGPLPEASQLTNLSLLQRWNFDGALLSGRLPTALGILTRLRNLNFAENEFEGAIPSELGRLTLLGKFVLMMYVARFYFFLSHIFVEFRPQNIRIATTIF